MLERIDTYFIWSECDLKILKLCKILKDYKRGNSHSISN